MRSKKLQILVGAMFLVSMSACTSNESLYSWHDYNRELLSYYKNSSDLNEFADKLREDIDAAEMEGKVPPGLYAEYGYVMLELGDAGTAVVYFQKERDKWPESAFLMESVISRLETSQEAASP